MLFHLIKSRKFTTVSSLLLYTVGKQEESQIYLFLNPIHTYNYSAKTLLNPNLFYRRWKYHSKFIKRNVEHLTLFRTYVPLGTQKICEGEEHLTQLRNQLKAYFRLHFLSYDNF